MEFSHCCNAYFRWCTSMHQRKVQGFQTFSSKTLALEQSRMALKTLALFNTHYNIWWNAWGCPGTRMDKE
jgi:hypothetical protein